MPAQTLFTQEEACVLLKTYPRQFRKIVAEHNIPYRVAGKRRFFTRKSIRMARPHLLPLKPGRQLASA
jgi:hypothetical protein